MYIIVIMIMSSSSKGHSRWFVQHHCVLPVNLLAFLSCNLEFQPILGEKVACASVSPHLYILLYTQVQCWRHSAAALPLRDFSNGLCHVMKITIAESNPYIEFLTGQTFCFSLRVLARNIEMPIMTMLTPLFEACTPPT